MRKSEFLSFKASTLAAASFVLAMNLATSESAGKLGLASLAKAQFSHVDGTEGLDPLRFWTHGLSQLVLIQRSEFKQVYRILLGYVNDLFFKGQLQGDVMLWFPEDLPGHKIANKSLMSPDKAMKSAISPSTQNSTPIKDEIC